MNEKAANKEITHKYEILEKFEAGIILTGPEVKSIKKGQINLKGSYIKFNPEKGLEVIGAHISAYKPAGQKNKTYNPTRARKILLNKKEINRLSQKLAQKGLTVAPIRVYTKNGLVKIEIALLRGLKKHDKRDKLKKKTIQRDIERAIRGKY